MEIDDVLILHLSEDVYLLLNVPHGHPPPRRLHPLLLDVPWRGDIVTIVIIINIMIDLLGSILRFSASFNHPMYNGKLTTAKMFTSNMQIFTS